MRNVCAEFVAAESPALCQQMKSASSQHSGFSFQRALLSILASAGCLCVGAVCSKEISKSNVVDDMVASNSILYEPGEHPDHTVVIK